MDHDHPWWMGVCETAHALYNEELGRPIDPSGEASLILQALDGGTAETMRAWIRASEEWHHKHDIAPITRLHKDGRHLCTATGALFAWRGLTAFRLAEMLSTGNVAGVEAYLDWAASERATVVRVLAMCAGLFRLTPHDGVAAMGHLLELAARRGLYVEAVALADTKEYKDLDLDEHVAALGAICAAHPNALVEIANEPVHSTQLPTVGDVGTLRRLALRVPSEVPVALGAVHGADDEDGRYLVEPSDYGTIHSNRQDGDRGWRHVRHIREIELRSRESNRFVVDDEPIGAAAEFVAEKRENDPAKWYARGALCRILGIGSTCHSESGLHARIPTGRELECVEAWRDGLAALPDDLEARSVFANTGWTNPESPVKSFDEARCVRCYSAVSGEEAWTCALGIDGEPGIEWRERWHPACVADHGTVRLYYGERK